MTADVWAVTNLNGEPEIKLSHCKMNFELSLLVGGRNISKEITLRQIKQLNLITRDILKERGFLLDYDPDSVKFSSKKDS